MLYQPNVASTSNQECPNQCIQGLQDDSLDHDSEVIFQGSDVSLLLVTLWLMIFRIQRKIIISY